MPKKKRKSIALKELQVEYVAASDLKPNAYNPNRQTEDEFAMLLSSMREDGFTQPVLVMQNGTIVDGEHRWRAAQELGYEQIPVVRVNMTEAQRRIATMRHNRARGQDDTSVAAELFLDLEKLGALDWAQDSLRLSDEEVRRLVAMADTVAEDLSRGHEFSGLGTCGTKCLPAARQAWRASVVLASDCFHIYTPERRRQRPYDPGRGRRGQFQE